VTSHCTAGHDQPRNPTHHPTLGLVPAASSVVFGGGLFVGLLLLEAWLLPGIIVWTLVVIVAALVVSTITQLMLGHRGWCWLWRSLRWWLGPVGSLIDPIEAG